MSMRDRRRGDTLIEFTLVGLPILFVGIAIVECALGMYEYQSMANAATIAARYAASHGAGCESPNTCTVTIATVANVIAAYTTIMSPSTLTVSFTDGSGTTTCALPTCETNSAQFPSSTSNANLAGNPITISLQHVIKNPLPMYWPPTDKDDTGYLLGANSVQVIQF
jgi:Flp pilus assembly protein TadG